MSDEEQETTNEIGQKIKMTKEKHTKNVINKKKKKLDKKPEENMNVTNKKKHKSDEKTEESDEKTGESNTNITTKKRKEYVTEEKQKTEQRINLKFLVGLKKTATESFALLKQVYGDRSMSRARVFQWHKRFSEGRDKVEDEKRSGRPATAYTPENVSKIVEQVKADNKVSIRTLAKAVDVNKATVRRIVYEGLKMVKVGEQLVPKNQRKKFMKKQEEMGNSLSEKQKKPRKQKKTNILRNLEEPKGPDKNACGNQEYQTLKPADHAYAETLKDNLYTGNIKDNSYLGKPNTNLYVGNPTNNLYTDKSKNNTYTSTQQITNNLYTETPKDNPYTSNPTTNLYNEKAKDNIHPEKPDNNPYPGYPYTGTGYTHSGYPCTSFSY
uniref:Mos1 transposase HTH domain-containing protein n=1 Tax=Cacopsylla melanoneura TaxID=428564 RepID=A0A8D8XP38_9HEMI